jgi:hypothetical protein
MERAERVKRLSRARKDKRYREGNRSRETGEHSATDIADLGLVALGTHRYAIGMVVSEIGVHRIQGVAFAVNCPFCEPHVRRASKEAVFFILEGEHKNQRACDENRSSQKKWECFGAESMVLKNCTSDAEQRKRGRDVKR